MAREKKISQNEVTGFLLGLGIGLVVGIVFKPQSDVYPLGLRDKAGRGLSRSVPQNSER